jgi:hypothetical protein
MHSLPSNTQANFMLSEIFNTLDDVKLRLGLGSVRRNETFYSGTWNSW